MADGTVYKRKDGRYECQIIIGRTLDGKVKRKSFYGSGPREVKQKRDDFLEKQARNEIKAKNMSFSKWAEIWLKTYKQNIKEYTYVYTYKTNIEKYLCPYFGSANLTDIKPLDVQNFFNAYSHLAQSTLNKFKIILNSMFETAIDNDMCLKNPARNITPKSKKEEAKRNAYTLSEYNIALKWAYQNQKTDIILLLETGVRRSELLGLRWQDVDYKKKVIMVSESIKPKVNKKSEENTELKSKSSHRFIPISSELCRYLKKHSSDIGRIINQTPDAFSKMFKNEMSELSKQCGIKELTPHELRHTFGTVEREKGVDIYSIQKLMGHSDIKVTSEKYVHNDISVLRKAMKID